MLQTHHVRCVQIGEPPFGDDGDNDKDKDGNVDGDDRLRKWW